MPIYEYRCKDCGREFEVLQKFSDKPVKKCVHCSGKKVEKLISQSSFHLKGGGWFSDGYSSTGSKKDCKDSGSTPSCSGCPSS